MFVINMHYYILSFRSKINNKVKFIYNVIGEVLTLASFIMLLIYDIRSKDVITSNSYILSLSILKTVIFSILTIDISICLYIKLNDD